MKESKQKTDAMIRKLRRTFVIVAVVTSAAVLLLTVAAINGVLIYNDRKESDSLLSFIAKTDGDFTKAEQNGSVPRPPESTDTDTADTEQKDGVNKDMPNGGDFGHLGFNYNAETKYRTRYFIVDVSENGEYTAEMEHIASVTEDEAKALAESAISGGHEKGAANPYRYLVTDNGDGTRTVVFLDCTDSYEFIFSSIKICALVFACVVAAILLASILICPYATRAFEQSLKKQKRFITDASHEIKTPLAIISANAEVLELSADEDSAKWIASIKRQTVRMSSLLRSLIELSKFDEGAEALVKSDFSLSAAVLDTAAEFEAAAAAKGMKIEAAVSPDVTVSGDEGALRHLTSILCENAVKHGTENVPIRLSLDRRGHGAVFVIENGAENISEKQLDHVFDRFYRADESRSRDSGGYGIGLSIAYSIAAAHGGTIKAESTGAGHGVAITVILP